MEQTAVKIKDLNKKKYPHLLGVLDMESPGLGMCIHRAAAFVLDIPGSTMVIAVCEPATDVEQMQNPLASKEPFIHAWAEYKDGVFAPTHLKKIGFDLVPQKVYYHFQRPTKGYRLTRPEVLKISGEIGLSAHLRKGVDAKASVGETFLNFVGMPWTMNADGGLIPLPEKELEKVLDGLEKTS
jgi:hypothetical protein